MSEELIKELEQEAKEEAYNDWERAGRPRLSKDEQDRMYLKALETVRARKSRPPHLKLRILIVCYFISAILIISILLRLFQTNAAGWRVIVLIWAILLILLYAAIHITIRHIRQLRVGLHDIWPHLFLTLVWSLAAFLCIGAIFITMGRERLNNLLTESVLERNAAGATKDQEEPGMGTYDILLLSVALIAGVLLSLFFIWVAVYLKLKLDREKEKLGDRLLQDKRWRWEFGHLLTLEIGIAIFVACLITVTLELFLRQRGEAEHRQRLRQTEKSVFNALFGYNVDRKLLGEIYKDISVSKFMREDCELLLEFGLLPDAERIKYDKDRKHGDQLLRVNVTVFYKLWNKTSTPQLFPLAPTFYNSLQLDVVADSFVALSINGCDDVKECVRPGKWSGEEIGKKYCANGFTRKLTVGDVRVNPRAPATVHYTYQVVKRTCDSHAWVTVLPMSGLSIRAVVEPGLELDFDIEAAQSEDLEEVGNAKLAASRVRCWRTKEEVAVLPYQGIVINWQPAVKAKGKEGE